MDAYRFHKYIQGRGFWGIRKDMQKAQNCTDECLIQKAKSLAENYTRMMALGYLLQKEGDR